MVDSLKEWDADFYDKNCIFQYRTATSILDRLHFAGDERVLDIGSGSGKIDFYLSQKLKNGSIVGVDASKEMVDFSSKNYQSNNLGFHHKNAIEIDYQEEFDFVISFWTLSWIKEQKLVLDKIWAALKHNGRLFLMYPMRHDAYHVADEIIKSDEWRKYFQGTFLSRPFFTETEYRKLIPSSSIHIQEKEIACHFSDRQEMQQSIRSWMSYLDYLPDNQLKQKFLDQFIEAYFKNRQIIEPTMYFSILEISGTKI